MSGANIAIMISNTIRTTPDHRGLVVVKAVERITSETRGLLGKLVALASASRDAHRYRILGLRNA